MNKKVIGILIAVVAVGAGSFFGGMKYGQSKVTSGFPEGNFPQGGMFGNGTSTRNRADAGGMVSGEIIAKDAQSLTLKMQDGGSRIVFFSDSTEISKSATGNQSDLTAGITVSANGTANQDGSLSAQSIQIRPNITRSQ